MPGCPTTPTPTPRESAADVRLAKTLEQERPETQRELGAGEISADHARVVAWALNRLPDDLPEDLVAAAEKTMLEEARHLTPAQLRISASTCSR